MNAVEYIIGFCVACYVVMLSIVAPRYARRIILGGIHRDIDQQIARAARKYVPDYDDERYL